MQHASTWVRPKKDCALVTNQEVGGGPEEGAAEVGSSLIDSDDHGRAMYVRVNQSHPRRSAMSEPKFQDPETMT
jgi:hypothetical protein